MMEFHPAAELFPLMEGAEYAALKADIRAHGLLEPIRVDQHTQKIIDGRNRYRACCELGIEPRLDWWKGEDPVAYVLSENLHRRHLDESQRAMVAARAATMGQGERTDLSPIGERSQGEAASLLNVGKRSVERAAKVLKSGDPDLVKAVDAGKVAVSVAAHLSDAEPDTRRAIVSKVMSGEAASVSHARRLVRTENAMAAPEPIGKYRVVYADPPWKYNDSGHDRYGPAERHYDALTVDELCLLPVSEMAEENAVLFLWVTSPMLEVVFPIIKAWGFQYKTSFVWDKVKHNHGHYNSVRHEFLLVCTRGSCLHDIPDLIDSVHTIPRSDTHSEKPEEFRQIIDRLYPHGNRIELFARGEPAKGWKVWGNECN